MAEEDYIDRMLKQEEAGKLGGSLKTSRPEGKPVPRPFQADPKKPEIAKPKSYAPAGMANAVKGDIGHYRDVEVNRAFPRRIKKAGGSLSASATLPYRKPAIEGGEGPHAV